jgi:hypothetical protein
MRTSAWFGLLGIAGGMAAMAAACSSTSAPTDKYPSVDSFCEALAGAECQEAAYCEVDASACKAVRKPLCLADATKAQGQGRTYTPSKAPDCVDAATKTYGSNNINPADLRTLSDTCGRVYQGSVAKNAQCTPDPNLAVSDPDLAQAQASLQCAGDAICDKNHCGDKVTKTSGQGCANPGEVCDTGYYCAGTNGNPMVCTPKLTLNQPCSATAPCAETFHCVSGACQARADIGGACGVNADCTSNFCDQYNGFKCGKALIFAPAEAVLCGQYGGAPVDGGQPNVPDSGAPSADAASE